MNWRNRTGSKCYMALSLVIIDRATASLLGICGEAQANPATGPHRTHSNNRVLMNGVMASVDLLAEKLRF